MRVVVTRPQESGEKTAALLRERGHEPVLLPLTRAIHDLPVVAEALAIGPAALAVTSAEAIRALESWGGDLEPFRHLPLFAVGSATAKAARAVGFDAVHTGDGDGRTMAQLVIDSSANTGMALEPVVYLAGRPREGGFEDALTQARIDVQTVEVYAMEAIEWTKSQLDNLLTPHPDVVLLYSRETARAFFSVIAATDSAASLRDTRFICMSEKVRDTAPEPFAGNAFAAVQPREAAMFDLLEQNRGT